MGFLDSLKKVFATAKPPVMESRRVQYDWGALRLPDGWQFNEADHRAFKAQGPAGCYLKVGVRNVAGAMNTEEHRQAAVQVMKAVVGNPSAAVTNTGAGLWVEAPPAAGVLRIAVLRFAAQTPGADRPPLLDVTVAGGTAPTFDQARAALRAIEWT